MIRKGGGVITLNDEVSERIHDRLSFQQWQDRFQGLAIVSSLSRMRDLLQIVRCGALVC
jgi:hypothetical protein